MTALVVNFNAEAANVALSLDSTDAELAGAIGTLSSGLAVQYSDQGPAAWSISNFLQYQSAGDNQAIANTLQGVSVLNIASGALNQIAGILDQMEQLATSSANAGAMTTVQMAANNTQFRALVAEINAIVDNTRYGTQALLNGTYGTPPSGGPVASPEGTVKAATDAPYHISAGAGGNDVITLMTGGSALYTALVVPNGTFSATGLVSAFNAFNAGSGVSASIDSNGYLVLTTTPPAGKTLHAGTGAADTFVAHFSGVLGGGTFAPTTASAKQFQVGFQAGDTVPVAIGSVSASALGIASADISTSSGAASAIGSLQGALSTLSSVASTVGATQQELQALHQDAETTSMNVGSANSSVVDANMATEMTTFTTRQILMQSGLAMIGQAQANPALVLKLL